MPHHAIFEYDYILVDVDSKEVLNNFEIKSAFKNYFVTGFDVYSLKKGIELLSEIEEPINLKKVLFSRDITIEEDEYLNYLTIGTKAIWEEEKIYFPFEQGDQTIIHQNQRVSKIKLKKLTSLFKDSLIMIVSEILEDKEYNELTKAFKQVEKGV